MPQWDTEIRTTTLYSPFSKMWPVSIKQTLDGFDLFRTPILFPYVGEGKFLLLFHSLSNLIRLHEMLCPDHWRLASSQEGHIIVILFGKNWPETMINEHPSYPWRRHQLYTLVALVACALLLWTHGQTCSLNPCLWEGKVRPGQILSALYGTYCLESPPWA